MAATASKKAQKNKKKDANGKFLHGVKVELKKVIWPTGLQVRQYFVVVLVFVLFIIAYVGLLDLGFGALLLRLLG